MFIKKTAVLFDLLIGRIYLLMSQMVKTACNVGDLGSVPGSGRSPGERSGYQLQYSCLENPMDRGT